MQLSSKTQNACLALLELARRHANPQPVSLKTIADEQGISSQFLVQILLQLKRAGIVRSTRGPCGGYHLAAAPRNVSLLDIVTAMEGDSSIPASYAAQNATARVLLQSWESLAAAHRQRMAEITLETLSAAIGTTESDMYYI